MDAATWQSYHCFLMYTRQMAIICARLVLTVSLLQYGHLHLTRMCVKGGTYHNGGSIIGCADANAGIDATEEDSMLDNDYYT